MMEPQTGQEEQLQGGRTRFLSPRILLLAAFMLAVCFLVTAYFTFSIKEVTISGSTMYTEDQVRRIVLVGDGSYQDLRSNAMFLPLMYRNRKMGNIPFVDTISVRMKNASSVEIQVKEKECRAYVHANGTNYYLDDSGIVQQASDRVLPDIPKIQKMAVARAVPGEPLESEVKFAVSEALEVLRMLRKYDLQTSSVRVEENGGISFKINKVRFYLGDEGYDYKVEKIRELLPVLKGRKGKIDLRSYEPDGRDIILQP